MSGRQVELELLRGEFLVHRLVGEAWSPDRIDWNDDTSWKRHVEPPAQLAGQWLDHRSRITFIEQDDAAITVTVMDEEGRFQGTLGQGNVSGDRVSVVIDVAGGGVDRREGRFVGSDRIDWEKAKQAAIERRGIPVSILKE